MTRPFRIDAGGSTATTPLQFEKSAIRAERVGFDGALVTETNHDPFVAAAIAARATQRIDIATSIAVAFARNPMTTAMAANDLQLVSEGRFILGLGSQVKPHIERRFSMPWSHPAARMADFIKALRAIWHSWETGEKLAYRGEFYEHSLMTPFFDPGPTGFATPPVWLAGVGELMTETAGEVADGFISHSFTTRRYLDEVTIPALLRGRAKSGRDATELGISMPAFVAMGSDSASLDTAIAATKKQIAFYGSTPSYLPVLAVHGWEAAHDVMNAGARRGEWHAIGAAVTDEMLDAFAVVGSPSEVAAGLIERFGAIAARVSFNATYPVEDETWSELLAALDGDE